MLFSFEKPNREQIKTFILFMFSMQEAATTTIDPTIAAENKLFIIDMYSTFLKQSKLISTILNFVKPGAENHKAVSQFIPIIIKKVPI